MSAKGYFISVLLAMLVALPLRVGAESLGVLPRSDVRLNLQYEGWARLIPTCVKLQYAGGMGLMSLGVGWDYGRKAQWESDVMVGFLPSHYANNESRLTFTLKQNYIPWSLRATRWLAVQPLTCGVYMNVISGSEFWNKEPSHYPAGNRGYYKFSSRTRFHLYVGQRFTLLNNRSSAIRSLSLFYEFAINDLMVVSGVNNRTLKFSDLFNFSVGAMLHIFKQ